MPFGLVHLVRLLPLLQVRAAVEHRKQQKLLRHQVGPFVPPPLLPPLVPLKLVEAVARQLGLLVAVRAWTLGLQGPFVKLQRAKQKWRVVRVAEPLARAHRQVVPLAPRHVRPLPLFAVVAGAGQRLPLPHV